MTLATLTSQWSGNDKSPRYKTRNSYSPEYCYIIARGALPFSCAFRGLAPLSSSPCPHGHHLPPLQLEAAGFPIEPPSRPVVLVFVEVARVRNHQRRVPGKSLRAQGRVNQRGRLRPSVDRLERVPSRREDCGVGGGGPRVRQLFGREPREEGRPRVGRVARTGGGDLSGGGADARGGGDGLGRLRVSGKAVLIGGRRRVAGVLGVGWEGRVARGRRARTRGRRGRHGLRLLADNVACGVPSRLGGSRAGPDRRERRGGARAATTGGGALSTRLARNGGDPARDLFSRPYVLARWLNCGRGCGGRAREEGGLGARGEVRIGVVVSVGGVGLFRGQGRSARAFHSLRATFRLLTKSARCSVSWSGGGVAMRGREEAKRAAMS